MYSERYLIDKSSNTFADSLAAFGLAFVLNAVANHASAQEPVHLRLEDHGFCFAVVCDRVLRPEWLQERSFFVGAPFLVTLDKRSGQKVVRGTDLTPDSLPEAGGDVVVDYEDEKLKNQAYYEWIKALPSSDRRLAVRGEIAGPEGPRRDWDVFRAINPGALSAHNSLMAAWWQGRDAFPDLLLALLQMTVLTPNDLDGAEKAWSNICKSRGWNPPKAVTAIQLLNPAQGKGTNYVKAEWRAPGNLKSPWLLEWLKMVGLFHGGFTRIVANPKDPRNAKDRKTYVLAPVHLEWGRHLEVLKHFRPAMIGSATAVKLDILAALRYTRAFLLHYEEARGSDQEMELFGTRPCDLVSGMQTAFYKNLGQSGAVMNIAAINLPRWVDTRCPDALAHLAAALDENITIVQRLDETRGDQFSLLNDYRDFLSSQDLDPFFRFTTAYGAHVMQQYERRVYVQPHTTTSLEVIFMNTENPTYGQIVNDDGFRAVAYAIRHSTVIPQARKARGIKPIVEIRYGLGQQLTRKAAYPADFLAEIAEFIHLYNAENGQLRENKREPFRKNVTTSDIDSLARLVDQFGSKVVCNMLVAYGYAREPRDPEAYSDSDAPDDQDPSLSETESDDDEDAFA